jgi:hypothetical protein
MTVRQWTKYELRWEAHGPGIRVKEQQLLDYKEHPAVTYFEIHYHALAGKPKRHSAAIVYAGT